MSRQLDPDRAAVAPPGATCASATASPSTDPTTRSPTRRPPPPSCRISSPASASTRSTDDRTTDRRRSTCRSGRASVGRDRRQRAASAGVAARPPPHRVRAESAARRASARSTPAVAPRPNPPDRRVGDLVDRILLERPTAPRATSRSTTRATSASTKNRRRRCHVRPRSATDHAGRPADSMRSMRNVRRSPERSSSASTYQCPVRRRRAAARSGAR